MHIAVVSPAGHGHVNPTLPLVTELVARGHRVTYATGRSLVTAVEQAGATALGVLTELPDDPRRLIDFSAAGLSSMAGHWLAGARRELPLLIEHFLADPPDAVCYDVSSFVGQILAQRLGVPAITLCPTFAGHEGFSYLALLLPSDFDPYDERLARFTADIRALSEDLGVPSDPARPAFGGPTALNLVFLPREFQLSGETFDDRFAFIGPSLGSREHTEDWQPPAELYERIGPLDIVIDDGSHESEHIIASFTTLFPLMRPGGLYVIEDLQTSYWPGYNGGSTDLNDPGTTMGFLKTLMDGLHHQEQVRDGEHRPTDIETDVTAVHLYHNLVFIEKGVNTEQTSSAWLPRDTTING